MGFTLGLCTWWERPAVINVGGMKKIAISSRSSQGKISLPILFIVPVLMFGFGYLMVPIYNVLCDLTGLNGKTGSISSAQASALKVDTERLIKVEFTGSLNEYAPWRFRPSVTSMMVHPGKAIPDQLCG